MTGSTGSAAGASQQDRVDPAAAGPSRSGGWNAWTGWIVFAAVLLILVGVLQAVQGLVALFDDGSYAVGSDGLAVPVDYTVWGVMHLLVGTLAVLIGVGLLAGNMVARGAAVVLATFSAIASLAFLPARPVWSLVVIALDVVVIHAVVVHGGELEK
ncbi:hypothetical protein [Blastococcus sp. URHD0036]|uniref:DUF7144 family membrane protein n=1 Tax=Blastococcus sp. URHD0036 TaxID=1380356 RepID=UPI000496D76C|nr:hypothetical protein [Blastococcus sp. URHD0036]